MKECYWCKKSCPDDEEGSFEVDPNDENIELGWICDHCVLTFDGNCDCEECREADRKARLMIKKYNLAHPKKKDWGALVGISCLVIVFAGLLWLALFSQIIGWF